MDACILTVEAGTNGEQGGDAGHGSRTVLRLKADGHSWHCRVTRVMGEPVEVVDPFTIEIVLKGDAEHRTFVDALAFAVGVYRPDKMEYHE